MRLIGIYMSNFSFKRYSETNRKIFLHIEAIDVDLFGLNAAAILSVIRSGETWRHETNLRNKKANDIAEMHGDKRWLPEDVSLGFTNQDLIDRTFGICGRNGVVEALKILQSQDVILQHSNPNKKYHSDKGRYFRFNQNVYDELVRGLKNSEDQITKNSIAELDSEVESTSTNDLSTGDDAHVIESNHRLNLNDAPFKNKRHQEADLPKINAPRLNLNAPRLNSVSHIRNSNNINKNNITQSINTREMRDSFVDDETSNIHAQDIGATTGEIISALVNLGFPAEKLNWPDALPEIGRLVKLGATVDLFTKAHGISAHATKGKQFGVRYLAKVVDGLLEKLHKNEKAITDSVQKNMHKNGDKLAPQQKNPNYKNNLKNAMSWAGDLLDQEDLI
jgi:hypothetical protein